jgi:uncharacterized protein YndB with AHSA1/START domain
MIRLECSLFIDRPLEEVFAFTTDPARLPEWQRSAVEAKPDGPMRPGATIAETRSFLGRRIVSSLEVDRYEPPHKLTLSARSGTRRFRFEQTTEAEDAGTRISLVVEGEPGSLFSLAGPLLERALRRELEGDAARLKRVLEARS